jgi:hypothetical protein
MSFQTDQQGKLSRGECAAPLCGNPWIECTFCPVCQMPFHFCTVHLNTVTHVVTLHMAGHERERAQGDRK